VTRRHLRAAGVLLAPGPKVMAVRGRRQASLARKGSDRDPGADEPLHAMRPAGLLRLQRTVGNAATTALLGGHGPLYPGTPPLLVTVQRQPKAQPNPVDQAGRALRDFEAWADDEKKRQNVVDKAAVGGLDPKQASSVTAAATKIAGYIPTMQAAAAKADPSVASLQTAVTLAKKAKPLVQSGDQADRMEGDHFRNQSREAVTQAISLVTKIDTGIDVKGLVKNLKAIETALQNNGSLADVIKYLNTAISELQKVRTEAVKRAEAAQRIDVLLRAFLTLNNPAFKAAPTAKEIADIKSLLAGGLGEEFAAVFDSAVDYDFFVDFANTWGQQIEARERMAKATGRAAPVIPSQVDAQTYFAAVAKKGNAEVFDAYQSFASAFFVHRGIASVADLRLKVPDLFGAKASITGRRGLVCTGFATMGAEVLVRAGATLDGFSVGIHASDDMVLHDQLEEQGHAIARMTRGGQAFSVSNQTIELTKNALVGKGAIVWGNQSNPLFVGDGAPMDAAVDKMMAKVAARKQVLTRRK
jgi:hypothetical protein